MMCTVRMCKNNNKEMDCEVGSQVKLTPSGYRDTGLVATSDRPIGTRGIPLLRCHSFEEVEDSSGN